MLKFLFLLLGIFQGALAGQNSEEKEAVLKRIGQYIEVVNSLNQAKLGEFWAEDAVYVPPATNQPIEGKGNVLKYLQFELEKFQGKQASFHEKSIEFPNPDESVVQGVAEIQEKGAVVSQNARKIELSKQGNQWVIDAIKEVDVLPAKTAYDHLKELSWLIGEWNDSDEDVVIHFSTKWDKYKNFLIQHFTTQIYGVDEIEGMQIIGWNPIEKKIEGWVFDSDGGVGQGFWEQKGKSWVASFSYTLNDGRKASALHIYTPIDENSYTYAATHREVDGEILPNLDPIKVIKEGR